MLDELNIRDREFISWASLTFDLEDVILSKKGLHGRPVSQQSSVCGGGHLDRAYRKSVASLLVEFGPWNTVIFDLRTGQARASGTTSLQYYEKMQILKKCIWTVM